MDFSSSPQALNFNLDGATPQAIAEVKNKIKHDLALANAQELLRRINENCFKMVITAPGPTMTDTENVSMNRCIDKYLASWDTVANTYVNRLQSEGRK
ncbi:protein translocase subunit [Coemansia sp. RSA 1933]|nr:protein translocase subunit [Coemansia sp. RSA 1933]